MKEDKPAEKPAGEKGKTTEKCESKKSPTVAVNKASATTKVESKKLPAVSDKAATKKAASPNPDRKNEKNLDADKKEKKTVTDKAKAEPFKSGVVKEKTSAGPSAKNAPEKGAKSAPEKSAKKAPEKDAKSESGAKKKSTKPTAKI